jgi:hypothetical protein
MLLAVAGECKAHVWLYVEATSYNHTATVISSGASEGEVTVSFACTYDAYD